MSFVRGIKLRGVKIIGEAVIDSVLDSVSETALEEILTSNSEKLHRTPVFHASFSRRLWFQNPQPTIKNSMKVHELLEISIHNFPL
jgi:hypothetical protein